MAFFYANRLVFLALLVPLHVISSVLPEAFINELRCQSLQSTPGSFLSYMYHEKTDTYYVIKQKKCKNANELLFHELVAAYFVKISHVYSYDVYFIPEKVVTTGKYFKDQSALLMTYLPGITIECALPFSCILSLRLNTIGLTEFVLNSAMYHHDFPAIVALDILLGVSDRHNFNVLYDQKTNRMCAIDYDHAFHVDVLDLSLDYLRNAYQKAFNVGDDRIMSVIDAIYQELLFIAGHYNQSDFCKYVQKVGMVCGISSSFVLRVCEYIDIAIGKIVHIDKEYKEKRVVKHFLTVIFHDFIKRRELYDEIG